jgi:hypothetical protein
MGSALIAVALAAGSGLAVLLAAFPLPVLAGLLATAGLLHVGLLRDLRGSREWVVAGIVGAIGFGLNLAVGLLVGLALWWTPVLVGRIRSHPWMSRSFHRFARQSGRP